MAQWELSPAFMKVHRRLGNMIFYELKGRIHARKRPSKREKVSSAQAEVIDAFKKLISDWRCLEALIQESWRIAARSHPRHGSGYTLFMGTNLSYRRRGKPLELSRPLGALPLPRFRARSGASPGEIRCEFACADHPSSNGRLFVYTQKRGNGLAVGELARVDSCPVTDSSLTIRGLEPGCEYFVYAVAAGTAYLESKSVSSSCCAVCRTAI